MLGVSGVRGPPKLGFPKRGKKKAISGIPWEKQVPSKNTHWSRPCFSTQALSELEVFAKRMARTEVLSSLRSWKPIVGFRVLSKLRASQPKAKSLQVVELNHK